MVDDKEGDQATTSQQSRAAMINYFHRFETTLQEKQQSSHARPHWEYGSLFFVNNRKNATINRRQKLQAGGRVMNRNQRNSGEHHIDQK